MRLGLGLSISNTYGPSAAPVLNPATLALTSYFIDYAGTSWPGTASAGTSGSHSLDDGGGAVTPPAVGANFGTHPSASFTGAGESLRLAGGLHYSDLFTRTAYFGQIIFAAVSADAPTAHPYSDTMLLADGGGNFYVSFTTSGVAFGHYDDASFKTTTPLACSITAKHCLQYWYDGVNLNLSLDGGAAQTAAASSLTSSYNVIVPRVGLNLDSSKSLNGRIAQVLTMASVPSSTVRANLYAAAQAGFGVP